MGLTVNVKDFADAAKFVIKVTGKDEIEVLNRAALHAVIGGKGVKGAIQRTPKASKTDIDTEVNRIIIRRIIERADRKNGVTKTKQQMDDAVDAMMKRRVQGIAYTRGPGWNNAAIAFGGRGVKGMEPDRFEKSEARKGRGIKAKAISLVAEIINTAPAIEDIGVKPLEEALGDVARDMKEFGERKLQEAFNRVKP